jgi:hypothetical protein
MVQLSATRCSCIAILWVILVSFATISLCIPSQRVFVVISVYFVMTQFERFWIHPCISPAFMLYCLFTRNEKFTFCHPETVTDNSFVCNTFLFFSFQIKGRLFVREYERFLSLVILVIKPLALKTADIRVHAKDELHCYFV